MRKISSFHLLTTADCNFRCKYCFESHSKRYMTEHTLKKSIEFIVNPEVSQKQVHIEFFGGEPLLTPNLVFQGVDYARDLAKKYDMQVSCGIVSNMSLVTTDILDEMKKRGMGFLASYDGKYSHNDTRHPNSEQLVADNIKLTLEKGVRCMVALQVVPGHLRELYVNFRSIVDLGINVIALNPVVHGGDRRYNDADWSEMDRQFGIIGEFLVEERMSGKKNPVTWSQMDRQVQAVQMQARNPDKVQNPENDWSCGGCKGSLGIDPEGYVTPCHQMATGWGYDEWVLGHVSTTKTIKDLDSGLRDKFTATKFEDCSECAVLRCAPCRTINKSITGSEYERAPQHCQFQRLLFTHAIKIHNQLLDRGHKLPAAVTGGCAR